MSMGHVEGDCRDQTVLFAPSLDQVVDRNHPVRVIDAFIDGLDMRALCFSKVAAEATGRPPYKPSDLLKLYVYGYLNQVRSSRRLEREAGRNLEVLWLIRRLSPSFKTIADFRREHPEAIAGVCRAFVGFCRSQSLYGGKVLAVDGSKIEAVASRKQVITPKSLAKKAASIDGKIAEYLASMDQVDREEEAGSEPVVGDVEAALRALRGRREEVRQQAEQLASEGLSQLVVSEPEARLMRTARHGHQVAYNAQTAVDARHGLIAAFDLTNEGNDQRLLHPMAELGQQALGVEAVSVVADTGYSSGEQGKLCEAVKITAIVPRAETVNPQGKQYFSRDAFRYDAASDSWECPAGETLTCHQISQSEQQKKYWTDACAACALKAQCTKANRRVVVRSFHEDAREAMHRRAMADPAWMKLRRELVEHPFGVMKWLMGVPRFLVRGLRKAKAELALTVLAFNMKRVINILGVPALLQALHDARA
jgi:transposase